jgi:hypothetical protein
MALNTGMIVTSMDYTSHNRQPIRQTNIAYYDWPSSMTLDQAPSGITPSAPDNQLGFLVWAYTRGRDLCLESLDSPSGTTVGVWATKFAH